MFFFFFRLFATCSLNLLIGVCLVSLAVVNCCFSVRYIPF